MPALGGDDMARTERTAALNVHLQQLVYLQTTVRQGSLSRAAETLHVSPETVRNHLKAMFKKTGTHSQEEITALLRASIAL